MQSEIEIVAGSEALTRGIYLFTHLGRVRLIKDMSRTFVLTFSCIIGKKKLKGHWSSFQSCFVV